ncbi:MAG: hypothetical protein HY913_04310 [Desulfomonile tiedjei]|nr:hypothetical protein [Desulfomonile tiedjei]
MSNELEDQEKTGILEPSEKKERQLTPEAERVIRDHLTRRFTFPGIALVVISFVIGFFIDRVAFQTASNQAFLSAQSEVMKLVHEVVKAKFETDAAVKAIEISSRDIKQSEQKAKKFADELSSLQSKLDSTVAFQASDPQIKEIAYVLATDPRITKVLNDLDVSIQSRLTKADQEIEKIKSAYQIDSRQGEARSLKNYKEEVFSFSFPVKHAWIELPQSIDGAHRLTITEIRDKSVRVVVERISARIDPRASDYSREFRMSYPRVVFRVWQLLSERGTVMDPPDIIPMRKKVAGVTEVYHI